MDIKAALPVLVRYLIVAGAAAFVTRGMIPEDVGAIINSHADTLVASIIGIGTAIYAIVKRSRN